MSDKKTVLDLDELFGQARAVKVKWKNTEYEFLRIEGISPKQAVRFQKIQMRASAITLSSNGDGAVEQDAKDAVALEDALDEMLKTLCAELPLDDIPFGMKLRIMEFYNEQTQVKKKVVKSPPPAPIGERSSAS